MFARAQTCELYMQLIHSPFHSGRHFLNCTHAHAISEPLHGAANLAEHFVCKTAECLQSQRPRFRSSSARCNSRFHNLHKSQNKSKFKSILCNSRIRSKLAKELIVLNSLSFIRQFAVFSSEFFIENIKREFRFEFDGRRHTMRKLIALNV